MLKVEMLNKYYVNGEMKLHALKNINFEIGKGEYVAIMGSSGSGKSTMMNILGCLDREFEGEYTLDDIKISQIDEKDISKIRNLKIGFVFQAFNLLPKLTALQNVELPLVYAGVHKNEREKRAKEMLEKVGLGERIHHKPNELSGGQKQRVAIARALVNNPAIILADEPTGNLDSVSEKEIMELFTELNSQGKTIIIVSHEPEVAQYVRRILLFKDGEIIRDGDSR
ncbi:MAG: ABC transporter ATP-binding protein [Fusobacterium mortiferum]|jgi:putative ABC transport system ATP-binding protein|uniref:ABC transporter ATP-binding protein n=1 Tax=Fusobacterium mortiferum TaxID=850 RepID=A0A414PPN5_FUSMR|nr:MULTISPECIES: ABC transporter ATP-binding protein [Fusobacterium]MCF2627994.1 ABC transporter ATP-binding protein [Fusobacterium mortiferum]MCF2699605.1 ABC transporter ATP-binding protein [Fusobacterium mortiferum]MCI6381594.1 ABC transporter ATP-binding protein [Fusobacterium mortiferum]MCI7188460.1 ABC transporter ATP-binding protein [Fusobacterium mortiferum]MCI7664540.1 ABC transporter ATP-binding protein [Fusobacterium mortiferum]